MPSILPDPYLAAAAPPPSPPRGGLSRMAVSSVVAVLFGPVGAILAILFGWYGRREIERAGTRRSGHALATAGMVLGIILTPAWGGALSYFAWTMHYRADPDARAPAVPPAADPRTSSPPRRGPPVLPAPLIPSPSPRASIAPRHTRVEREGKVTVVDVGASTTALADELAKQRAEAAAAGEALLVMTTAGGCDPCRGVDRSLRDPLMQTALARVRIVRVDVDVFHEDLDALHIPYEAIPGFFLPALDFTPRDGIDGGEWGEDIAPNIAPVLGAFVRGKYTDRHRGWRPVPGSGTML
jgi:hypothetical protein